MFGEMRDRLTCGGVGWAESARPRYNCFICVGLSRGGFGPLPICGCGPPYELRPKKVLSNEVLDLLRCPETRMRLGRGEAGLVARLNREITAGRLRNRRGVALVKPIDALLVREDGRLAYPVIDDIPILLADEAVEL